MSIGITGGSSAAGPSKLTTPQVKSPSGLVVFDPKIQISGAEKSTSHDVPVDPKDSSSDAVVVDLRHDDKT